MKTLFGILFFCALAGMTIYFIYNLYKVVKASKKKDKPAEEEEEKKEYGTRRRRNPSFPPFVYEYGNGCRAETCGKFAGYFEYYHRYPSPLEHCFRSVHFS